MSTIPRQFWDFLKIVDGDVERSDVFLRTCAGAFLANSAADEFDLIGFDVVDAKRGGPICGRVSLVCRHFSCCQDQCLMQELQHLCVVLFQRRLTGL